MAFSYPYEGLDAALDRVERFGSAGEKQIARALAGYNVRFLYEHPVAVVDRGRIRLWYPDFWLPNYCIALEYVGIEHHNEYTPGAERRKAVFEEAGIPYMTVQKSDLHGPWPKRILEQIHGVLEERLERFETDTSYGKAKAWYR
ncbi:MAG: hypothetical protein IT364_09635 [Candidatus Hydrogenedentes bacterium]|nr:hypothetical protein [Candidatus Hydrogenedentota bacterium]